MTSARARAYRQPTPSVPPASLNPPPPAPLPSRPPAPRLRRGVEPGPQHGRVRLGGGQAAREVLPRGAEGGALLARLRGELVHAEEDGVADAALARGEEEDPGALLVRQRQREGRDDVLLRAGAGAPRRPGGALGIAASGMEGRMRNLGIHTLNFRVHTHKRRHEGSCTGFDEIGTCARRTVVSWNTLPSRFLAGR